MAGLGVHHLGVRRVRRRRCVLPGPDSSVGSASPAASTATTTVSTVSTASTATTLLRSYLRLEGGARRFHAIHLGREGNSLFLFLGWNIVVPTALQVLALDLASTHEALVGSDFCVVLVLVILDTLDVGLERRIWHAAHRREEVDQEICRLFSSEQKSALLELGAVVEICDVKVELGCLCWKPS
jgi:hypothetical protein